MTYPLTAMFPRWWEKNKHVKPLRDRQSPKLRIEQGTLKLWGDTAATAPHLRFTGIPFTECQPRHLVSAICFIRFELELKGKFSEPVTFQISSVSHHKSLYNFLSYSLNYSFPCEYSNPLQQVRVTVCKNWMLPEVGVYMTCVERFFWETDFISL